MTTATVRSLYRELAHIIKHMPERDQTKNFMELRSSFRRPIGSSQTMEERVAQAESRISFLRMTTTKVKPRGQAGTWVYKDGERLTMTEGTLRDAKGRVITNWDGKNLDPESVKRHRQQLRRAGFVNNSHAKGLF